MRNQVLALLKDGLPPAEIRTRLEISANTFYYHVRRLHAAGHIFPVLAARRGRPPQAEDRLLAQWLAIKEQFRDRKIGKFLRVLLEEAYRWRMIDFEVYRDPLPHQSPVLQRHPQLSGYDGVAAVTAGEMRLLRALASELEKHGAEDGPENLREALAGALGEKEISLKYKLMIKRTVCRVEIIRSESEFDMRYELTLAQNDTYNYLIRKAKF